MTGRDVSLLATSVGNFAVALVAVTRGGKSPLALPLAAMAFDLGAVFLATLLDHLAPSGPFDALDATLTSLAPALVVHVVLAFVGRTRSWRPLLAVTYVFFGAFAVSSATALVSVEARAWIDSNAWAAMFLAAWTPLLAIAVFVLVRHLRLAADEDERARTRMVLAALAIGGSLASTEVWTAAGVGGVPSLGAPGTLLAMGLLTFAALRHRLFGRALAVNAVAYAAAGGLAAVVAYVTVLRALGGSVAAALFGASVVTALVVVATREAVASITRHGERVERLAVMGRFAAQMAHDLKNPLAALSGAAQLLEGAPRAEDVAEFAGLMREQIDRIRAIVDKYDRVGRVEPVRSEVDLDALVRRVLGLQAVTLEKANVQLELALAGGLPSASLDPDLVAGALENLVQNAVEAMPAGGRLRVTTALDPRGDALVLAVEDEGAGVDPRWAERAFDDFVTTKATGSGLGLAFVRRVALAHGGDAALRRRPPPSHGTTAEIRFPLS